MKFKPVDSKVNFPELEEKIIKFWQKNKIFEKSVEQRPKDNAYLFYDGPPFVTGYPHYGQLTDCVAKDLIPRYQTMKGKRVKRVWGWDCHGLPIENKVEQKLGFKNRRDILKFGINNFIEECRKYVEETSSEWKWYVDHIGRWVDFDHAYRTMDLKYMETVIWVFKQLYDKDLIYKGTRVSLFCPRCSTPVSNFEVAMDNSYAMMKDPAVTVKFAIRPPAGGAGNSQFANSYILAWTTTPWTLPANRALVVDPKETYVMVEIKGEKLILAKKRVKVVFGNLTYKLLKEFKGKELLGLTYEPLYNFFPVNKKDMHVYEFEGMVNMDEGTGVVHSAPGFGEIDTQMGKQNGLTMMFAVDDEGKYIGQVKNWAGVYVKKADPLIIEDLQKRNLLFKSETISHRYPFCYRCETPLIYKAQESWFIDIQKLKPQLLKTNENINWVPSHYKHGRFKKGIESAPDWCISRTRYWATIMPIWVCEKCGELKVVGSIEEIEKLGGQKVTDLHRTGVDYITFKCDKCQGTMKRVPEVLDCWMESGSMPYAQIHYPFENKKEFDASFPADYIVEYTPQVRAWFYVMHVVANALMNSHGFKNVVVHGIYTGTDGRKMSKSYHNYPDPKMIMEKNGGDAIRLYLMSNVIMSGRDVRITKGDEIIDQVKMVLLPLWNSYKYFLTFANLRGWQPANKTGPSDNVLDQWLLAKLNRLNKEFSRYLDSYRIPEATRLIKGFVEDLSKWYIRRSRDRFGAGDKQALATLYQTLVTFCKIAAPIIPFVTEEMYKNLTNKESVHLENWPKTGKVDQKLIEEMELVRKICELGHAARKDAGIKVRQPLKQFTIYNLQFTISDDLIQLIKDELNIKKVDIKAGKGEMKVQLDTKITPELKAEGEARELVRKIQELRKQADCRLDQKINVYGPDFPKDKKLQEYLKSEALIVRLVPGKDLKIEVVR